MKIPRICLVVIIVFVIIASPFAVHQVAAQATPISDAQANRIRANCTPVLSTLNQLHVSDTLLRVNRGQMYESISDKLMQPFNARVSGTGYDTSTLVSTVANYDATLNQFRSDYQTYEQQLSNTLNIDCSTHPADFYAAIVQSRNERNTVHADIIQLNALIVSYQAAVIAFGQHYQPVPATPGVAQ